MTAGVAAVALIIQVGLVISGDSVLLTSGDPPTLVERLARFVSYFTVQSNVLVMVICASLVLDPRRDGRVWRVQRIDGLVGIAVTGVVHWFYLRPLLNLEGLSYLTDKMLHVAVPLLAVVGWFAFGPRPRVDWRSIARAVVFPVAYIVYVVVVGAATGWYPYPFTDVGVHGYGTVALNGAAVLVLFLTVSAGLLLLDRRLPTAPIQE